MRQLIVSLFTMAVFSACFGNSNLDSEDPLPPLPFKEQRIAGGGRSIGMKSDNKVYTWGDNALG
ncbi:MAG: RCC1 domain-containing protein [Candidatus Bathyarchaeota archaeon]